MFAKRMFEPKARNTGKHGRFLTVTSVLLVIYGVLTLAFGLFEFAVFQDEASSGWLIAIYVEEMGIPEESLPFIIYFSTLLDSIEGLLDIVAGILGMRVARGRGRAQTCEIVAIVILGFAVMNVLTSGFSIGFRYIDVSDFAFSIFFPLLYMIATRVEAKSKFWREVEESRRATVSDMLAPDDMGIRDSYVEIWPDRIEGAIAMPLEKLPSWIEDSPAEASSRVSSARFAVSAGAFEIEPEDERLASFFESYRQAHPAGNPNEQDPAFELCTLLRFAIKDDAVMLTKWRDVLHRLEDIASGDMSDAPVDFERHISDAKNSLHALMRFYKQIGEMCRDIATADSPLVTKANRKQLKVLADKARRLASEASDIAHYASEVRMLYQSRIGAKQAEITTVLTIVATICMSVSVITGWYGMNFENMPELANQYSYLVIIVMCVTVVTLELIFFKKRKWF